MRFHLIAALLVSVPAAAAPDLSVRQAPDPIQAVRGAKPTLQQIARASKPSPGHRMLYVAKRVLR